MKRVAVVLVTAGCSALFGIDKIPYEGSNDGGGQPIDLTVAIYGSGTGMVTDSTGAISCSSGGGGTCTGTFGAGATVTLTPTAAGTSAFFGWAQACLGQNGGSNAQCTLDGASGPVYVVADFSPFVAGENQLTLSPSQINHADGSAFIMAGSNHCDDDGQPCAYSLDPSITSVTLTPFGDQCVTFVTFAGSTCAPGPQPCTITFSGSGVQSVVVDFEFGYATSGSGSGSGMCSI